MYRLARFSALFAMRIGEKEAIGLLFVVVVLGCDDAVHRFLRGPGLAVRGSQLGLEIIVLAWSLG